MNTATALGNGIEGPARWSLRLFGDFQLSQRLTGEKVAVPGKRERVILANLALSPDCRQPRRKLVTLLWGEGTDETSLDNLRVCVFNLRKALGDAERQVILSDDRDIVLDASAFEIDVLSFRRLVAGSGPAELEEAAKLYSGDFLEGLSIESDEFESWCREEATRCKGQALDGLTRLMTQRAALGENQRAIEAGLRILRLEPLHEAAARGLMRLYGGSGQRGTAVHLYRNLVEALRRELGAKPEAETRAIFAEISRGGEEKTQAPVGADAKPPPSVSIARPGDVPPKLLHQLAPTASDLDSLSWPAKTGHPSDEGLIRHVDPPSPTATADMHTPARLAEARQREGRLDGPVPSTSSGQSHDKQGAITRTKWILAGGLAAVIALFAFLQFATTRDSSTTQQTGVGAAKADAIALAVLPFANLSGDPSQEFFSDGMTEEITAALARVKGLTVLARTSAFEFKGQNRNIRAIGEALNARYLIEGSVRKEGDRVRITAQLVQADNGANVWSESYDRQLTSVFATQEEIALAIAGALMMPLGLRPGEQLVSNRTSDPESYQQYLRARALYRDRARAGAVDEAIKALESLVVRDPNFAPGWGLLAQVYVAVQGIGSDDRVAKAARAATEALRLDSRNAAAYAALASMDSSRGRWAAGEDGFRRALALDPNEPDILERYSTRLAVSGRIREALALREKLNALEPFVPIYNANTARFLVDAGQSEAAIAILQKIPSDDATVGGFARGAALAQAYAAQGRYPEAADALLAIPRADDAVSYIDDAARLLRSAPRRVSSPETLLELDAGLNWVYTYVGALDRVFETPERNMRTRSFFNNSLELLWTHAAAPLRKTERFRTFVRDAGLVDYWRARGWPEFCRSMGADDFVCD